MNIKANAMNEQGSIRCERKFQKHKLEKNQLQHMLWWEAQFEELEAATLTPQYKRMECLRSIFTDDEIDDIEKCGVEVIRHSDNNLRRSTNFTPRKGNKSYKTGRSAGPHLQSDTSTNPYLEFMNKTKQEARSWYPKPKRDLKDIPIIERAEKLKIDIVKKFLEKFESKSDEETTLLSIFELICPFPICDAINTRNEVFGAMPETTTKHLGCHEHSAQNKLLNEITKDIQASEKPPAKIAFGLNLPIELRHMPFKEHPGDKWEILSNEHENIKSFAHVWKDITDLESTRRFCLYLLDHPEVNPPPYLLEQGMLIKKILKKPVYLGDLEKQYENQDYSDFMDIRNIFERTRKSRGSRGSRGGSLNPQVKSASSLSLGAISDVKIMV